MTPEEHTMIATAMGCAIISTILIFIIFGATMAICGKFDNIDKKYNGIIDMCRGIQNVNNDNHRSLVNIDTRTVNLQSTLSFCKDRMSINEVSVNGRRFTVEPDEEE
jgi:hypothetical protein